MTSQSGSSRFSLLVGINAYLVGAPGSSRLSKEGGSIVSLNNLEGPVNDVEAMSELLRTRFNFNTPMTLVSSPCLTDPHTPEEPETKWPTHANIKREFDRILSETKRGDVFLFYFAGHGSLLDPIDGVSPNNGNKDPSLMTMDYCRKQPAIRGWELNVWLQAFNEKGVKVIVILDSCYSAGSWRGDSGRNRYRTPEEWKAPPNLPSDEAILQGTKGKPGHRDGELEVSWDINPREFTLMAACQSDQLAAERNNDDLAYGAFTLALRLCIEENVDSISTYRSVRERTTEMLVDWKVKQRPQVFGDDRLAFLEDYEPVIATPVMGRVEEDNTVNLSVGEIHGINIGTQFVSISKLPVTVEITAVNDHKSKAKVVGGGPVEDPSKSLWLLPSRWSKAETLKVTVDPDLGSDFRRRLTSELNKRLIGQFSCSAGVPEDDQEGAEQFSIHLEKNAEAIDIRGPTWLLGKEGHIRDWKVEGRSKRQRAVNSAVALRHLFRFGQILHLQSKSEDTPPFKISITPQGTEPHHFKFKYENTGDEQLYFFVFILASGFHVKQLWPSNDMPPSTAAGTRKSFKFKLSPPQFPGERDTSGETEHRDIIRTIVVKGMALSMKSIELPNIWHAGEWEKQAMDFKRDAALVQDLDWWVYDQSFVYRA